MIGHKKRSRAAQARLKRAVIGSDLYPKISGGLGVLVEEAQRLVNRRRNERVRAVLRSFMAVTEEEAEEQRHTLEMLERAATDPTRWNVSL